ncbi:hypothetical protein [Terriglobus saanensis]|uniref:Thymidylate synthase n=1 Tax=Terriglobus saanensis (strain ATCC BAA-1853 / DSM 23119 / SP1PR4) TaxID=401053 RepID=E8UYK8_TERSS|nr:hypothetical protein [Terriglobus saanensis]ADV83161.1 hypothetical protein AciPR4_2381 [Terriglobus saanensis SP1PR4]
MPEITEQSLSRAWLRAIALANASPRKEVSTLVVNLENLAGGVPVEDGPIRSKLDEALESNGNFSVATVANTIFPSSLIKPDEPRHKFFERYLRVWPRINAIQQNRRGTYFQRLIAYPHPGNGAFNQLDFVISAYRGGTKRRSALQCAILAPSVDLNATPFQGFPCMQQVAFLPEGDNGLRISALYPMHYLWARAYGNYLGLLNLGQFMAREMGLELTALTCVALVAKLDKPNLILPFKGDIDAL